MTTTICTDQNNILLTALMILGVIVILKIVTTVTLLAIAARQKKSVSILLGHPFIKNGRKYNMRPDDRAKKNSSL